MTLGQEKSLFKDIKTASAVAVASLAISGTSNAEARVVSHYPSNAKPEHAVKTPYSYLASLINKVEVDLDNIVDIHSVHRKPHLKPHEHKPKVSFHNPELSKWLYTLRFCESSDNYSDNTGNGFYGAYQFTLSTWESLGLEGLPSNASPIVQDRAIIENTDRSRDGLASQNPGCYESTGISAYPPKA